MIGVKLSKPINYIQIYPGQRVSAAVDLAQQHVWVAADPQDQPVAFALAHLVVQPAATSAHLHELDVHPQHARQGLGRQLIEAVAQWARAQGATALTLTTFRDVAWNGPYYARLGFHVLDVQRMSPALRAVWRAEEAAGLPMEQRICMRLDL